MESIEQTLNGTAGFGNKVTTTVSRNGDLISNVYFEYNPNALITNVADGAVMVANMGNTLLKEMELEIGGQRIDKHYSHWLTIWQNLTEVNPTGASAAIGAAGGTEPSSGATLSQLMSYNHQGVDVDHGSGAAKALNAAPGKAFVPLQFYFCRNPGLALPLIALQYHEVKISLTFCALGAIMAVPGNVNASSLSSAKLWVDYIYLDTDERRRFAQQSHEYLIEQLQFQQTTAASAELNFNHPVKELIWCTQPAATPTATAGPATPVALTTGNNFQIKLNGHDRFAARDRNYFTRAQVHQHHSGYGGVTVADSIAVYSFALRPEEHQPSGSCNFSRIDNARLVQSAGVASLSATNLNVYAVNYNVLRIMSGMGGLAYSN
tara:strand:- start:249 stop:1382 length:1134 start_codon:yes stop_codon:yes gene_type:complete